MQDNQRQRDLLGLIKSPVWLNDLTTPDPSTDSESSSLLFLSETE